MEIVAIEAQTFDRMLQRLKDMARITDEIYKMHGERKIGGWMDSQDACLRLGVSPRTLQTFRDNGTLAYSRIGHKIYCKRLSKYIFYSSFSLLTFATKK